MGRSWFQNDDAFEVDEKHLNRTSTRNQTIHQDCNSQLKSELAGHGLYEHNTNDDICGYLNDDKQIRKLVWKTFLEK